MWVSNVTMHLFVLVIYIYIYIAATCAARNYRPCTLISKKWRGRTYRGTERRMERQRHGQINLTVIHRGTTDPWLGDQCRGLRRDTFIRFQKVPRTTGHINIKSQNSGRWQDRYTERNIILLIKVLEPVSCSLMHCAELWAALMKFYFGFKAVFQIKI